jgi:heme/copper-type cytochrome/quinol oxidase subunit 2
LSDARSGYQQAMNITIAVIVIVLLFVPIAVVGFFFVWAARKDGAEDKALQRKLGRRSTRLGR